MYAYAPTGSPILGTLDNCPCRAEIVEDSYKRHPDGTLDYEHAGGTEMFYDDQRPQQTDGEDLYLDEDGNHWKESELVFADEPLTDEIVERMKADHARRTEKAKQEPQEGREYRVLWEIDINAPNARAAAVKALTIQRDRQSIATAFECTPMDGSAPTEHIDIPPTIAEGAISTGALQDARELGTVLAALRWWEIGLRAVWSRRFSEIHDEIATNGQSFESLDASEIDALCERLNCGPWDAKLIARAPALNSFVEQMARLTTYEYGIIESWTDDQAEDALTTLNTMIPQARALCPQIVPPESEEEAAQYVAKAEGG